MPTVQRRHRTPLTTTQYGEVADHINSLLPADNPRLEHFESEPMSLRKLSKVSPRMRIAASGSEQEILVLAHLDGKAKKASFTQRASNTMKHP